MSEEIGEALRETFEETLEALGQPFIVHSNINTPDASQIEVNGFVSLPQLGPRINRDFGFLLALLH